MSIALSSIDRDAQFQPIIDLLPKLKALRKLADAATDALTANSKAVDDLRNAYLRAYQKIGPFSGATPDDYIAFGNAQKALQAEQAKSPALMSAAQQAILDFRNLWLEGNADYQNLQQDPGVQEMV